CAIPIIRGKHFSRPTESIIEEITKLTAQGVKEFNLIAQDSTYYGYDLYGKRRISELIEQIANVPGVDWLRLLYTYPTNFPLELLNTIANHPNICKYIDIPLQHISDKILNSMNRGTSRNYIIELISKIKETEPNIAIRSTFIVGYPGETEKDFEELYEFIISAKLDRVGVFTYSHEEGTSAFELADNIPDEEKEKRRDIIMLAQNKISLEKNKDKIGKTYKVIVEEEIDKMTYLGRTEYDAPDVDNSVTILSTKKLQLGNFEMVTIIDAQEYDLIGKI
ncbi:MAG: MiaB/RimO family radical SAM methylthiotransferase, partial [FCB group bacterium]